MKTSRHIVLSILLTLSLLSAPIAFAQPHAPSNSDFDVVEFFAGLFDDIVSIIAPAAPVTDPSGATEDDNKGLQQTARRPGTNDAAPVTDPAG